jgi:DNA-3-methyladenine glycosylase I
MLDRMIEIPPQVTPTDDSGYLDELTKAIFRAGFSWRVVRGKWDSFRRSFDGFEIDTVAGYGPDHLDRLFNDAGIVRNRRKILATIENAQRMQALIAEHGSFHSYLRSLDHLDYYGRVKVLTDEFAGLGRTGAFVFLHCVNEETPSWAQR